MPSMKKSPLASHQPLLLILTLALLATHSQAQSLYWDINDTTPGSGGPTPTGVWDLTTLRWNNAAGDTTSAAWTNSGLEAALFAAGSDATGTYSVTLGAGRALKLSALTLNTGNLTLTPQGGTDGLDFGAVNAALNVAGGSTLSIASFINGSAGMTKSGTGIALLSGSVLPAGAYAVQGGDLQLADGVTANATTLTLGAGAGVTSTLTLGTGTIFNLGGNVTFSSATTPLAGLIQGGTLNLNGTRNVTTQNIAADPDLTIQSVIADGSASSGLTKAGGGSLLLSGNNTYTGVTTNNGGTLHVQGNSASIAASIALVTNAATITNIGAAADTVAVNRLGDSAAITLDGGNAGGATLNYTGADFASQAVHSETAGALTVSGNHRSFLTLTPGSGDEVTLTFASLARLDHATALVRGSALGSAAGTAGSSRVFFASAPTLTGGIVPWLLVDASATGNGTGFATYDATNGLRLLTVGEYTAPASATTGSNVLKSSAGNITVSSSVDVNSWTSANTGTTTLGSGVTLGLQSGAVLFTSTGTLTGGTLAFANGSEGIIHLASGAAVTATVNSVITGSNGLTFSSTGAGNKILVLGGSNTFTGDVRIYAGILQLGNANALNGNALQIQTGGSLRLNGNSISTTGLNGAGALTNNSASIATTLTVNGGGTFTGTINNGAAATLALTKTSSTTLTLQGNNAYTGATIIQSGTVQVGGGGNGGRFSGTTSITVSQGAKLQLTNTNGNNVLTDRVNDAAAITLSGGTFEFNNSGAANTDYSEAAGAVTLAAGASQITTDQSTTGRTSTLTFTSVTRNTGGSVNFTGGASGLGASTRNRLDIGGLAAGFIGGWATVGNEFAKYITDIDSATAGDQGSVAAFAAGDYSTLAQADWTNSLHVKPTADQTLNGSREAASANLTAGIDLNLGTHTLTLSSGGLIKQGGAVGNNNAANRSQITNGTLTAGTTADAELFARVTGANLNITATIADNLAGAVHLVKTGTGTLFLGGASTYSGSTMVHVGTLTVGVGGDGSSAAQAGATGRTGSGLTTVNVGATLTGTGLIQGGLALNGGTLRPGDTAGNAVGTLWVGGDATFTSGVIALQITSTSQHDTLKVGGSFDWATGASVVSILNNGYTPTAGDVFDLLDWAQVMNTEIVSTSTGLELFDLGGGFLWDTSLWASHGQLVVSIPEPSRALLMLAGLSLMSLRRRRAF
jgi:autotransporter-associated beta strand protein